MRAWQSCSLRIRWTVLLTIVIGRFYSMRAESRAAANLAMGNVDRARELIDEALEIAERGGARMRGARLHLVHAQVVRESEGRKGRDAIEDLLAQADARLRSDGALAWAPFVLEERARLAQVMGDDDGAERQLREALELFSAQGSTGHVRRLEAELGAG